MGYIREWTRGDGGDCSEHWKAIWELNEVRPFRLLWMPPVEPRSYLSHDYLFALRLRPETRAELPPSPLPLGPLVAGVGFSLPFVAFFFCPFGVAGCAFFFCPFGVVGCAFFLPPLSAGVGSGEASEEPSGDNVDNRFSTLLSLETTFAFFFLCARAVGEPPARDACGDEFGSDRPRLASICSCVPI